MSILIFVILSLNSLSQVRFDSLLKVLDQRQLQKEDSVQIIVFKFADIVWNWSVFAVYKDVYGNWHGKYYTTKTKRNRKKDINDPKAIYEIHKNYELTPKSSWTNAVKAIYSLGIDTLASQGKYANGRDGTTYSFHYNSLTGKREASYWCPHLFKRKHQNDRLATKIIKVRQKYFRTTTQKT